MFLTVATTIAGVLATPTGAHAVTLSVCAEDADHSTLASAVDAADPGDIIEVCAGTLSVSGVTTVETADLTIRGAGRGAGGTVIETSGSGIDLKASGVTLQDLRLQPATTGTYGINVSGDLTDITMDRVAVVGYGRQLAVLYGYSTVDPKVARVTGLTVRSSEFLGSKTDGDTSPPSNFGWQVEFNGNVATKGLVGIFDVEVSDTVFADHAQKGLYIESMSNALFEDITIRNSGIDSDWKYNNGFDINLKYGDYENIAIRRATITGSGLDAPTASRPGSGTGQPFAPSGLAIKARDDGSYGGDAAASLDGVLIEGVNVSGGVVGIRIGEEGKGNAGPTGVVIRGSSLSGTGGTDLINDTLAALDARFNWWGDPAGPALARGPGGGQIRSLLDVPVTFEPFCTSASDCPPAPAAAPDPGPGYLPTAGGAAPTVTPGSASIVTSSGEAVVPEVGFGDDGGLGSGAVVISTPELTVAVAGDRGASPAAGAVAAPGGEIVSRIEADIPAGAVVEVWLFSTPRLVAAARADEAGQVDVTVPLSAPLDGGGPVEPGTHTMQLLIPTSSGLIGVNVGVTVGGPVPTSVPSGAAPSLPLAPSTALLAAGTLLVAVVMRRRREVAGPA